MKVSIFITVIVVLFLAFNILYFSPGQFSFVDANPQPTLIPGINKPVAQTAVKIEDEKVGTGREAKNGDTVSVNYRGTLTNGTEFDSSYKRNQAFSFRLGTGEVIKGWDQGVAGMKVGGKRKLTIPPALGYGEAGSPPAIPGNSTLIFEVELVKIQ